MVTAVNEHTQATMATKALSEQGRKNFDNIDFSAHRAGATPPVEPESQKGSTMQVTLVDHTQDAENFIGRMAAICYDGKTDRDSNLRRAIKCKADGHLTTLRFASATFNIQGISRICSHQFVRVAHAGILQKSQRYVEESDTHFIVPEALAGMPPELQERWKALEAESREVARLSRESGLRKEDARFALLHSAETELNVSMNFQAWLHFLKLRTDKHAQWEIRAVAIEIGHKLAGIAPHIFEEYA